jgi:hypothetical protein
LTLLINHRKRFRENGGQYRSKELAASVTIVTCASRYTPRHGKNVVTSKHEHWPPYIVRCLNSNHGLTAAWIWQWTADSEDNECSCYDGRPREGTECFLTDDSIFDNKSHYYNISTIIIFSYCMYVVFITN